MAMAETTETGAPRWAGTTEWARERSASVRTLLRSESGSAGLLIAAIVAALIWANVASGSYERAWSTRFTLQLGDWGVTRDIHTWVNSGLMTLFFFVVGLAARREFDLGELRDRRRVLLPAIVGLVGMIVPVGIYLAVNAGGSGVRGWGVAMSTDTALALGLLAVLGRRRVPERVRLFLLTVFVVDDVAALVVIAFFYSGDISWGPLVIAGAAYAALLIGHAFGIRLRSVIAVAGIVMWLSLLDSGIDPIVAGLALGLSVSAYTPSRSDLDEAAGLVRSFREQPTPELARSATRRLSSALSGNDRLQHFYDPWASYVIVPLFALANAGVVIDGNFLAHAYTAPVTLGVLVGYVLGKPIAVIGASWVVTRMTGGRLRPSVGWASVLGSGTIAGIGFTVALLIAARAFHGPQLAEAKLGALSAAVVAPILTWAVFRVTALLPPERKARALLGDVEDIVDLESPVDPDRDHVRGRQDAVVTIVEYGDFQCPYCGQAEPVVRDLIDDDDIRYVWRHLPLHEVHPQAQLAAEAAEAAAAQGAFWSMHDLLLTRQDHLKPMDLVDYAGQLGLDRDRFHGELTSHHYTERVAADIETADRSGVSGTPTFFINGRRHYGAYDIETLTRAVRTARARALIASRS